MIKRIKNYSLQKKRDKSLKDRDLSQRNSKLETLSVLIDLNYIKHTTPIESFGKTLKLDEKKVQILYFDNTEKKSSEADSNKFSPNDFKWNGNAMNQNVKFFIDNPVDVLIGVFSNQNKLLNSLAAQSLARFKIGYLDADSEIFDLILNINPEKENLLQSETIKFLKILNKI